MPYTFTAGTPRVYGSTCPYTHGRDALPTASLCLFLLALVVTDSDRKKVTSITDIAWRTAGLEAWRRRLVVPYKRSSSIIPFYFLISDLPVHSERLKSAFRLSER